MLRMFMSCALPSTTKLKESERGGCEFAWVATIASFGRCRAGLEDNQGQEENPRSFEGLTKSLLHR